MSLKHVLNHFENFDIFLIKKFTTKVVILEAYSSKTRWLFETSYCLNFSQRVGPKFEQY